MADRDMNQMVGEMRLQLLQHQTDLQKTLAAIESINRNNTVVEKSMKDIRSNNDNKDFVWEAVGRSFVKISLQQYEDKMKNQIRDNIDILNSLNKKKHYLETSVKNTTDTLKKVLNV